MALMDGVPGVRAGKNPDEGKLDFREFPSGGEVSSLEKRDTRVSGIGYDSASRIRVRILAECKVVISLALA
jgi:hypothetical protein